MTAKEIIRMEYGDSRNFITPNRPSYRIVKRGEGRIRAIEIAHGTGFSNNPIYGVSVVDYDKEANSTTRRTDLSSSFSSTGEMETHIKALKEEAWHSL